MYKKKMLSMHQLIYLFKYSSWSFTIPMEKSCWQLCGEGIESIEIEN